MRKTAAQFALIAAILISLPAAAQTTAGTTLEESVAPGRNYDKAEFKLWLPNDAASVQAIAVLGGKDLEFRTNTITGLFAVNRRAGALWALAEEPSAAHIVGRSRDVALVLFEDALALAKTFQPIGDASVPNYPTAWLPTARVAERWQWLVTEKP